MHFSRDLRHRSSFAPLAVAVTVTASTDKTGGAADADWEMESHGLNVATDYFDVEALEKWKHAAIIQDLMWGVPPALSLGSVLGVI